ncbi:hypothetical protein AB0K16_35300 [Nonomuraea jabiensis]|uniref:hypothetical protein n=1 Tax=Nonomuraea jabiensis TaxID=882448 RepID=UPI003419B579
MSGPDQLIATSRARLARARFWTQMLILLVRPESLDRGHGSDAPPHELDDRHTHARSKVRRRGVVWLAYGFSARNLLRLLAPALLVFLPIGLLAVPVLFVLVDGSAAVVNGDFELVGRPEPPLLGWAAAVLVVSLAGQAVALPATVVLAAGLLVGKKVSISGALRAAARRWPAMAVLVLVGVVACTAALAAGLGVLGWTGAQGLAYAVMAVLALFAMPCLLAVASVTLEGRPAKHALARAYRLTAGASGATAFTLAFGVVLFPVLAEQAANWAVSGLPIAPAVAGYVLALVAVPFQAAVIARLFLHRLVIKGTIAEFKEIVDGLPESAPRPARLMPVLAGLLLPGLLYGGAVLVNPLGWPEVSETAVTRTWPRDPDAEVFEEDGRTKPELGASHLQALYAGRGGRMVMLMDDFDPAKLLTCMDSTCAQTRLTWAEPVGAVPGYTAAGARLADGRLVVSTWAEEGADEDGLAVDDDNWRARLGLLLCDATACVPAPGGKPITEVTSSRQDRTIALAVRPGGGLLVAQFYELPWGESDTPEEGLSITTCDDPACTRPHTKEVAKLPADKYRDDSRGLITGVGPDDRPVVLRFDRETGAVFVISCDDPACARTRTGRPARGSAYYSDGQAGAAMLVRADGRPLIAYLDVNDSAIKLLDCRTRECSQAGTTTLSGPGHNTAPAMVLDRDGRVLVAYQDLDRDRIVIATCTGTACVRTPVTTIARGGGRGLAMALDGRGRPMIAWTDFGDWHDWDLVVTTALNLPPD